MKRIILGFLAALLLMVQAMPVMAAEGDKLSLDNLSYTFTDIDGNEVTTQSSGKPKLLVFFRTGCWNCRNTLRSIASSDWLANGDAEVYAIDIDQKTVDEIKTFQNDYCAGSAIKFVAEPTKTASNAMFAYNRLINPGSDSLTTPLIVMLDKENKIQYMTEAQQSETDIAANYLPTLKGETGTTTPDQPGDSQNPSTPGQPDNPDNPSNPDNPNNPDNPQEPSNPGDNQNPEQPDVTPDTNSGKTACNHVGESNVISQATATSDAVVAVECVKCGAVFRYETVSNSAYAAFLKETANAILNAEQNGEAVVNTKIWTSFNKAVFEAMKSRPDVKVTVNYVYQGNPYVLNIPAKANVDSFMDENGFGGFRYIEQVLSAK